MGGLGKSLIIFGIIIILFGIVITFAGKIPRDGTKRLIVEIEHITNPTS